MILGPFEPVCGAKNKKKVFRLAGKYFLRFSYYLFEEIQILNTPFKYVYNYIHIFSGPTQAG